jgi:SulP family sulfate permease
LNIIDEITETRGRGNKEAISGVANILSGVFLVWWLRYVGTKPYYVSNGARARLSGIVAAIALLLCHVWCWSNRNFTNGCSTD